MLSLMMGSTMRSNVFDPLPQLKKSQSIHVSSQNTTNVVDQIQKYFQIN